MTVAVVGGGAAGIFGAIAAARASLSAPVPVHVVVLEAGPQLLSKVLVSGGGRCNVTHACFEPKDLVRHYPRGQRALLGPFHRFQPRDTVAWFVAEGVSLKTEADGRMFPTTDDSQTIADALIQAARRAGVELRLRAVVTQIDPVTPAVEPLASAGFWLTIGSGERLWCDRLLLATGSSPQGHRWARQLGHAIAPPVPSLFTFSIRDPRIQGLAGVSVPQAHLRLVPQPSPEVNPDPAPKRSRRAGGSELEQVGPLLVTHWGLSGPGVLKLSAWGARSLQASRYRAQLWVNWVHPLSVDEVRSRLLAAQTDAGRKSVVNFCPVELPRRLWQRLLDFVDIDPDSRWAELPKAQRDRLATELTQGEYTVMGKGMYKEEFVTCGGVELGEVNFKTMESRCCPGLYLAGELLDVDGITGGFNFQNAWTTGWLAGQAIAESCVSPDSALL
jgi:predicted Rossmann fold flavoprotein